MKRLPVLPPMRCDDGCGDCCGPVPASPEELAAIRQYVTEHGIVPRSQGLRCPFFDGARCSIYPVRPTLCQAFGHTDKLRCHRGHGDRALQDQKLVRILRRQGRRHELLHSLLRKGAA